MVPSLCKIYLPYSSLMQSMFGGSLARTQRSISFMDVQAGSFEFIVSSSLRISTLIVKRIALYCPVNNPTLALGAQTILLVGQLIPIERISREMA